MVGSRRRDAGGADTDELRRWLRAPARAGRCGSACRPGRRARRRRPSGASSCARSGPCAPQGRRRLERMRSRSGRPAPRSPASRRCSSDGATERAVQIELEAEAFRRGAEAMAYDTIVGSGPTQRCCTSRRPGASHAPRRAGADRRRRNTSATPTSPARICVGGAMTAPSGAARDRSRRAAAAIDRCRPGSNGARCTSPPRS